MTTTFLAFRLLAAFHASRVIHGGTMSLSSGSWSGSKGARTSAATVIRRVRSAWLALSTACWAFHCWSGWVGVRGFFSGGGAAWAVTAGGRAFLGAGPAGVGRGGKPEAGRAGGAG